MKDVMYQLYCTQQVSVYKVYTYNKTNKYTKQNKILFVVKEQYSFSQQKG